MAFSIKQVTTIYQRWAKNYDLVVRLYALVGFRFRAYRSRAVELLHLSEGDHVIDLGCGTGLNFPLILTEIGPKGRLIGVDLSAEMLAYASRRVESSGWINVELVESDMAAYVFPHNINGVIITGAIGYVEEYDGVIRSAREALTPGGRLVILDGREPERWPSWLIRLFLWLTAPFGVSHEYLGRETRESVEHYFQETSYEEFYGGAIYLLSGAAPNAAA